MYVWLFQVLCGGALEGLHLSGRAFGVRPDTHACSKVGGCFCHTVHFRT